MRGRKKTNPNKYAVVRKDQMLNGLGELWNS